MSTITLGEAVSASNAADAAVVDAAVDLGESIAESAIAGANERADAAEEMAQRIAEGALESERGRRIDALENEVRNWQDVARDLSLSVQGLTEQMAELRNSLTAVATLEIASLQAPSSLNQPILTEPLAETLEQATEIAEVIPEAIRQNENIPAEIPPARKVRRLI